MKTFNKTALALALMAGSSVALAEFSANIGVTSNYVWRGVTQTDNEAAVSGGIDFAHDSGFYLGLWASNVDFAETSGGTDSGEFELDIYGGYGGSIGEFGYDIGLIGYTYSDSSDANFLELALSGSFKMFSAGLNYTLDGEADDDSAFVEEDVYYWANLSVPLPQDWSIGLTVGHYEFDNVESYDHGQLDIGKSAGDWGDFTFSASIAEDDAGNPDGDDPLFFVSWAKGF